MDEFQKWCPTIPVALYHGDPAERARVKKVMLDPNIKNGQPSKKFPVVCTSYEMVLRDKAVLGKYKWAFIIIVSPIPGYLSACSSKLSGFQY